jgi:hypothetical protein
VVALSRNFVHRGDSKLEERGEPFGVNPALGASDPGEAVEDMADVINAALSDSTWIPADPTRPELAA